MADTVNGRQQADNRLQQSKFDAVQIPTDTADLATLVKETKRYRPSVELPATLRELIQRFVQTQDVVLLHRLLDEGKVPPHQPYILKTGQQAKSLVYCFFLPRER